MFPSTSKYAWINPALNSFGAVKAKLGTLFTNDPVPHSDNKSLASSL
jgi:hypothetical protein